MDLRNERNNVPAGPAEQVFFDQNTPTTVGVVFEPNTPNTTDTLYVSSTNGSTWIYNGSAYVTYTAPVVQSTPFYIAGTAIDAGSNKTASIERNAAVLATSFNTKRGLTYTGVSDNNKWRKAFAYSLSKDYVGDSFQLLMNEYNTSNGTGKSVQLNIIVKRQDPSIYVSVNINSNISNFDLANFAVQYDSANKRINFYYKTLTTYTSTNWTVLNARATTTSDIVWYNQLLGATLVGQPDDAFTSKTISLNKVNGAYTFPTADGTANFTFKTDGSGNITFVNPSSIVSTQTVTSNATITATSTNDLVNVSALAVGTTIANPTGTFVNGQIISFRIKDNATPQTIAYGAKFKAFGSALPTTTVASKITLLSAMYNSVADTFETVNSQEQ